MDTRGLKMFEDEGVGAGRYSISSVQSQQQPRQEI